MTVPQVVVFDLGKVLVDFDYFIAAGKIASGAKLLPAEIKKFIDHSPLLFRYETGLLTSEQFYTEICAATGYAGNFEQFGAVFADIFAPIEPMVELNRQLRQAGLPTYIFSNTNPLAVGHIRQKFPFFAQFNDYILSYEHGAMKPDQKLYEVVEQRCQRRGAQILYLDDRLENIQAGAARGWQVILQETPEKSRKAVQNLGLLGSRIEEVGSS